ncbi:MAG TPA: ATP-binding protein [Longimicrobiales bacterium]|nr:ATP-binding protein [Longimicrobiales bacterium]
MPDRKPRFFSLERKLPILIGSLVAAALFITLFIVRHELRASAIDGAQERLGRVTQQLGELATNGIETRVQLMRDVARHGSVVAFAAGRDYDHVALLAQLQRLRQVSADSALPVQLRMADGRLIDARPQHMHLQPAAESPTAAVPLADTVIYSPLQRAAGGMTYWVSAPVRANGRIVGHVVQQRGVRGGGSGEQIEALLGSGIEIHFANVGGTEWIALEDGAVINAPAIRSLEQPVALQLDGTSSYAYATALQHAPWMLVSHMPMSGILARPDAVLRRLSAVALLLLLLGAVAAWLLSRTVTHPLRKLRAAADAIAAGDYSRRTQLTRTDEIGRVARSFDDMADRIDESHAQLAFQFREARTLARELENTNTLLNRAVSDAENARLEAQLANRAKSEFLATMSHEIRTPINAVVGYTDLMDVEVAGPLTPQQRDYVERIRRSAEHLTSLVNDVLDFAKVESGQMRIRRDLVAAPAVIDAAVSMIQNTAHARNIQLTRDCPPATPFVGDAQRVQQILLNLLSNAVKFTDAGGHVRIGCSQRESRPAGTGSPAQLWTCIAISDTGIGIHRDQIERIFDPFVQGASGYTRAHAGTGLGLAISRSLARMIDGDITVESQPAHGSTFTLWLPREHSLPSEVVTDTRVTS